MNILLPLVQIVAISTFTLFMLVIFPRKINSSSDVKKNFFGNKSAIIYFLLFSFFYMYLFTYLFFSNTHFSPQPIFLFGGLLSLTGLVIAFTGRWQLRNVWTPITNTVKPKTLLDYGIFGVTRHPIYAGRFLFFTGVMLMVNLQGLFIALLYWFFLRKMVIAEEEMLLQTEPDYKNYIKRVPRIIF